MKLLGIDIGGSGIKGAPVDLDTGELTAERFRLATPEDATPEACTSVVRQVVEHFGHQGAVGAGFPGVIKSGVVKTTANLSDAWLEADGARLLENATGCPFVLVNDADAAGIAEMRYGAGRNRTGLVVMVTIGTGLGTALFIDGHLVPNTELGHLELNGREAEKWSSDAARKRDELGWKKWAKRFNAYLNQLHAYLWPDLFILGGGASRKAERFLRYLEVPCEVVPAKLQNEAGIVGAAVAAEALARSS
jgi:polyphosphate glucokinase